MLIRYKAQTIKFRRRSVYRFGYKSQYVGEWEAKQRSAISECVFSLILKQQQDKIVGWKLNAMKKKVQPFQGYPDTSWLGEEDSLCPG